MTAKSSIGLKICMTGANDSGFVASVPASITEGNGVVTVAIPATTGVNVGDLVTFAHTGSDNLDGKTGQNKVFVVSAVDHTANTVAISGVNVSNWKPAQLDLTSAIHIYPESYITCLCLSSLALAKEAPVSISVATFCDPSASIPGLQNTHGTLTMGGFVDVNSADYRALSGAEEDTKQRFIRIQLPNNGWIVAPIVVSQVTWELPLNGAIGFTATAVLAAKPNHAFDT